MNEKEAIADALTSCNNLITMLNYGIMHSNNKSFRDTLCNSRNQMEALQWELYLFAKQNGYYVPAAPAGQADVEAVKSFVTSC